MHFWELYQDCPHPAAEEDTLDLHQKILLQDHFSVPLQALQAQPKGFPMNRLQMHLPSSCVLLSLHWQTAELLTRDRF